MKLHRIPSDMIVYETIAIWIKLQVRQVHFVITNCILTNLFVICDFFGRCYSGDGISGQFNARTDVYVCIVSPRSPIKSYIVHCISVCYRRREKEI